MVDESRRIDVDTSVKDREWGPEEFASVLFRHTEMTREMRDMKPSKRVAMFHVDARSFAKSALPYPQVSKDFALFWVDLSKK